jgi:hypothetical protein
LSAEEGDPIVITVPTGVDPQAMPTDLTGWEPAGPPEGDLVRVYGGGPPSNVESIGGAASCFDGIWTARWRSTGNGPPIRAAVAGWLSLQDADYQNEVLANASSGGAGYLSGRICERPVFDFAPGAESNIGSVVIEWQQWTPRV